MCTENISRDKTFMAVRSDQLGVPSKVVVAEGIFPQYLPFRVIFYPVPLDFDEPREIDSNFTKPFGFH